MERAAKRRATDSIFQIAIQRSRWQLEHEQRRHTNAYSMLSGGQAIARSRICVSARRRCN